MARFVALLSLCVACVLVGCSGEFVKVAPAVHGPQTDVGSAKGEACGMLLFDFIPIGVNDRTEQAYARALTSAGATALTNTYITQRWYYAVVGVVHCTEVQGIAVR